MLRKIILIAFFLAIGLLNLYGQTLNLNIDQDSLFLVSIQDLSVKLQDHFSTQYAETSDRGKQLLLSVLSLPRSSKEALISNIKDNEVAIWKLKSEYDSLVPDSLIVSIQFNPENINWQQPASISIKIIYPKKKDDTRPSNLRKSNLQYNSIELDQTLALIGWNINVIKKIKSMLDAVNCISIENGIPTTVGFARNGMGKFSYTLIPSSSSENKRQLYHDPCYYISYKPNIFLTYHGGAIGPQCFALD